MSSNEFKPRPPFAQAPMGGRVPTGKMPSGNTPPSKTPFGNVPSGNAPPGKTPSGNAPSGKTDNAPKSKLLPNGFSAVESSLLHDAISLAGMTWFDGDGLIMGKKGQFELIFRAGESQTARWVVMAFPLYNMNEPNAAEICLHFLTEAHTMIHVLDFQYQVGINMETENLEFLMQLPMAGVTGAQLADLIQIFFDALANSVMQELTQILDEMNQ